MIKYVFILFILLFYSPVEAKKVSPRTLKAFQEKWEYSAESKTKIPNGYTISTFYERKVTYLGRSFPVANIRTVTIPKGKGFKYDEKTYPEEIRKALDIPSWKFKKKIGDILILEGLGVKQNRWFQLYVLDEKESFSVSMALIRIPYMQPVVAEARILQMTTLNKRRKKSLQGKKTSLRLQQFIRNLWRGLIIPEVYGVPPGWNIPGTPPVTVENTVGGDQNINVTVPDEIDVNVDIDSDELNEKMDTSLIVWIFLKILV